MEAVPNRSTLSNRKFWKLSIFVSPLVGLDSALYFQQFGCSESVIGHFHHRDHPHNLQLIEFIVGESLNPKGFPKLKIGLAEDVSQPNK
jgi:hypothetical protein